MEQHQNIPENSLIELYKKSNSQDTLAELYQSYIPLVYGVGLKYLQSKSDAEDLTMNVYEHISKKLKTHDVENFKSWLYVVTKNLCYEKLRKDKRSKDKENDAAVMYSDTVFHPDNINQEDVLIKLKECMATLNEDQKSCIEDFYYKNLSYNIIAEKYGLSWNRVRSYIQNGRRMLKNCIDKSAK